MKYWICLSGQIIDFIFGNGPEYDRDILELKNSVQSDGNILIQGQDVANGVIYALIRGGLIGLLCYLIIIFRFIIIIQYDFVYRH